MPIGYTNRQEQRYFLHNRKDKAGKIRYHCSLKSERDLAMAVPEGFETTNTPVAKCTAGASRKKSSNQKKRK